MNTVNGGTFTYDDLNQMFEALKDIPPAPMLGSTKFLPTDQAIKFRWEGVDYCLAHPDMWSEVLNATGAEWKRPLTMFHALDVRNMDIDLQFRANFLSAMGGFLEAQRQKKEDDSCEHEWKSLWTDYRSWGSECSRCKAFRSGDY